MRMSAAWVSHECRMGIPSQLMHPNTLIITRYTPKRMDISKKCVKTLNL